METLTKIAFDIRNIARSTHGATTDKLSIEQIKFWINSYRALFIRRDSEIQGFNPSNFESTFFVPFEPVPAQEYPVVFSGRKVLSRSCSKIPLPVRSKTRTIGYIGSADFNNPIPFVNTDRLAYIDHSPFGSLIPSAYMLNERLYVTTNTLGLLVSLIADDYEALATFKDQYGEFISDDSGYPIPSDYIARIRDTILKVEVSAFLNIKADDIQDNIQQ